MLFGELYLFVGALLRSWWGYLTGGPVIAILWIYEHKRGRGISWKVSRWAIAAFLVVACFDVWRSEHIRGSEAQRQAAAEAHEMESLRAQLSSALAHQLPVEPKAPPAVPPLAPLYQRAASLSGEILAFTSARASSAPMDDSPEGQLKATIEHDRQTLQLYAEKFSARVSAIHDELENLGIRDAELDRAIATAAGALADVSTIKGIGTRLGLLSRELRDAKRTAPRNGSIGRRLTAYQQRAIVEALSATQAHVRVCWMTDDKESVEYGQAFAQVFREARWNVSTDCAVSNQPNAFGMTLYMKDPSVALNKLTSILEQVGVSAELQYARAGQTADIDVLVAHEPPW